MRTDAYLRAKLCGCVIVALLLTPCLSTIRGLANPNANPNPSHDPDPNPTFTPRTGKHGLYSTTYQATNRHTFSSTSLRANPQMTSPWKPLTTKMSNEPCTTHLLTRSGIPTSSSANLRYPPECPTTYSLCPRMRLQGSLVITDLRS